MDNQKIGSFIKERRKEQGMTQLQLAEQLRITDRAVSKWERGLSAPDIGLLEPLSGILGCTVTELIRGECENSASADDTAEVIGYAKSEIAEKLRRFRKRYLALALYILLLLTLTAGLWLWHSGVFFLVSRTDSPDGGYTATLYDRDYLSFRPWVGDEALLKIESNVGKSRSYVSFPAADSYQLWWSPDGEKLVLEAGGYLELIKPDMGTASNLEVLLSFTPEILGIPADADFRFLQWGEDSKSILFNYRSSAESGYFWYNYHSGTFSGHVKI